MNIEKSEKIDLIAMALMKFQSEIGAVYKNDKNYQNKFANINQVIETIKGPMIKNGLAITQHPGNCPDGSIGLYTILMHTSGQYIQSFFSSKIVEKPDIGKNCQDHGKLITYYRRYAMLAALNLATTDDDDGLKSKEDHEKSVRAKEKAEKKKKGFVKGLFNPDKKEDFEGKPSTTFDKEGLKSAIRTYRLKEEEACKIMGISDYNVLAKETRSTKFREYINAIEKKCSMIR